MKALPPALRLLHNSAVLKKFPVVKEFSPSDKFSFNKDFSNKATCIKLTLKETGVQRVDMVHEQSKLDLGRKAMIDSAIVRNAKTKSPILKEELIAEVVRQTKLFTPTPDHVRQCAQLLVEREFLREEGNSYIYLP